MAISERSRTHSNAISPKKQRYLKRLKTHHLGAFPAMVAGGKTAVHGEICTVDRWTLTALDRLEGNPRFYQRRLILLDDGSEASAYLLAPEQTAGRTIIMSGDWRSHRKERWT